MCVNCCSAWNIDRLVEWGPEAGQAACDNAHPYAGKLSMNMPIARGAEVVDRQLRASAVSRTACSRARSDGRSSAEGQVTMPAAMSRKRSRRRNAGRALFQTMPPLGSG